MAKTPIRRKVAKPVQLMDGGANQCVSVLSDLRDAQSLTDAFARAAFKDRGYAVKSCESFKKIKPDGLHEVFEAIYLLTKARGQYRGTVMTGAVPAGQEMPMRQSSWIADISPKR